MIFAKLHGHLATCQKCGLHMLVEEHFNGSSHTVVQIVSHWECLTSAERDKCIAEYRLTIPDTVT